MSSSRLGRRGHVAEERFHCNSSNWSSLTVMMSSSSFYGLLDLLGSDTNKLVGTWISRVFSQNTTSFLCHWKCPINRRKSHFYVTLSSAHTLAVHADTVLKHWNVLQNIQEQYNEEEPNRETTCLHEQLCELVMSDCQGQVRLGFQIWLLAIKLLLFRILNFWWQDHLNNFFENL